LTLIFDGIEIAEDQKIAAFGSSYKKPQTLQIRSAIPVYQ